MQESIDDESEQIKQIYIVKADRTCWQRALHANHHYCPNASATTQLPPNMRRAQSVRNHHPRPSLALGADDLGVLSENGPGEDATVEDMLRKQLLDRDRLCSKVSFLCLSKSLRNLSLISYKARYLLSKLSYRRDLLRIV